MAKQFWGLTLYHTILTFKYLEKEAFCKHCRKPAFSPLPTMFSTLPKINFNFLVPFILSSANAFNLDNSIILSFGKELMAQGRNVFENMDEGDNAV